MNNSEKIRVGALLTKKDGGARAVPVLIAAACLRSPAFCGPPELRPPGVAAGWRGEARNATPPDVGPCEPSDRVRCAAQIKAFLVH